MMRGRNFSQNDAETSNQRCANPPGTYDYANQRLGTQFLDIVIGI